MKNNLVNNLREGLYKNNQTKPKPDIDRNMVLDPPAAKWQQEQDKNKFSEENIKPLLSFIKEIKENWDCDDDAHKYNTICRCCDAEKTLDEWFKQFKNK
jgi:hypothetical protein